MAELESVELTSAGLYLEPVAGWGRHAVERGAVVRPERLLLPPGAPGRWRDRFTGEPVDARVSGDGPLAPLELPLARVFRLFPLALLAPEEDPPRCAPMAGPPVVG